MTNCFGHDMCDEGCVCGTWCRSCCGYGYAYECGCDEIDPWCEHAPTECVRCGGSGAAIAEVEVAS